GDVDRQPHRRRRRALALGFGGRGAGPRPLAAGRLRRHRGGRHDGLEGRPRAHRARRDHAAPAPGPHRLRPPRDAEPQHAAGAHGPGSPHRGRRVAGSPDGERLVARAKRRARVPSGVAGGRAGPDARGRDPVAALRGGRRPGRQAPRRRPRRPAVLDSVPRVARGRRHSGVPGRPRRQDRNRAALGAGGAPPPGAGYIIGLGPDAMFTGIVSAVGRVQRVTGNGKRGAGITLTFRAPYRGVRKGESIAVNGACLTVERVVKGGFTVHVVQTTAGRTLFDEYAPGRRVNLERALRATDRLGGHFVQGHVDGVATVERVAERGDAL